MLVAMHLASLIRQIGIYAPVTIFLVILRGFVVALQFAGGWTLAQRKPQGRALAMYGLIGGALLTPIDIGLGLAPSPIYLWWRWQATGIYAVYAAVGVWILTRHGAPGLQSPGRRSR